MEPRGTGGASPGADERARRLELLLAQREAALALARRLADASGPRGILSELLDSAIALLGATGGAVDVWPMGQDPSIAVRAVARPPFDRDVIRAHRGVAGRAIERRAPCIDNDYQRAFGTVTTAGRAGIRAAVAAPLIHDGRLLGVVTVGAGDPDKRFTPDDVALLELLAGFAGAAIVAIERTRLEAVAMTARELAHRLNNDLGLPVGLMDLLREAPGLSPELRAMVDQAAAALAAAAERVRQLQRVVRFEIYDTPVGPALDLERSAEEAGRPDRRRGR